MKSEVIEKEIGLECNTLTDNLGIAGIIPDLPIDFRLNVHIHTNTRNMVVLFPYY